VTFISLTSGVAVVKLTVTALPVAPGMRSTAAISKAMPADLASKHYSAALPRKVRSSRNIEF